MRSERGQAISLFIAVLVPALLLIVGLVVDGGQQSLGARKAEFAAAAAARAAVDATAAQRLAGQRPNTALAVQAARESLAAEPDVRADIDLLADGRIRVRTQTSVRTILLSLVGINALDARGEAAADLFDR